MSYFETEKATYSKPCYKNSLVTTPHSHELKWVSLIVALTIFKDL
jgi:hypothetical protein